MPSDRIPSGITGFDALIQGGLVPKSVNLITGGPGTGKTIFALQMLYNQIKAGRNCLYVTFEESLEGLHDDGLAFGWDFAKFEKEKKCVFIAFEPMSSPSTFEHLTNLIRQGKISFIVIDGISVMTLAFESNYYKARKELYSLCNLFKSLECTSLFTAEISGEVSLEASGGSLSRDGMIEFIADAVVTVHNSGIGGEGDRAIRVLKMRRTNHVKGPVPLSITGKGITVEKPVKL